MQLTDEWIKAVLNALPEDSPARLAIQSAQKQGKLVTAVGGVNRVTGDVVVTPVNVRVGATTKVRSLHGGTAA